MRVVLLCLTLVLLSCDGGDIDKVKPGMTQQQVIEIMGNPDEVFPASRMGNDGTVESITLWQYGSNQGLIWKDGQVQEVIPDLDALMRELQNAP
ncbi:MAG: outer membrane protein assembly factor BamE [Bacteroidia bacterium]|nr:outer membrane protein assembly factor BamE [Bacteroidia bacterium]